MFAPGEIEQAYKAAQTADGIESISRIPGSDEGAFAATFDSEGNATKYRRKVQTTWFTLIANQDGKTVTVS